MLKKRLIPVLLLQNGLLVRSEKFSIHQVIGNPIHEVQRFNEWSVDELIYLDITREGDYDQRRADHKVANLNDPLKILEAVAKNCFMPLTWGGRIRSFEDVQARIRRGADKVAINTAAFLTPELIQKAAGVYGSQAIVASIDVRLSPDERYEVVIEGGRRGTGLDPVAWARQLEQLGAGEILLQSVERDGRGTGYDLKLIERVSKATRIPVIACSGVGRFEHYAQGIQAGASAVAAANLWHFKELADRAGKRALHKAGVDVRL